MKVALVHDYLHEYGGAERVLETLAEMYPAAPIYTAFYRAGSVAHERFKHREIRVSWAHYVPGFAAKLHSPLRFLAPYIWQSFDFSGFDVVISSSSWYITKGIRAPDSTLHVSYIHTPPRYLYGYATSVNYQKYWPIRVYATVVNKYLRQFDFESAQRVDVLVANSEEVRGRINKFWRRDARVIYPPVSMANGDLPMVKRDYFLTGGRLVGPKHFDVAIAAANELGVRLKIFGTGPEEERLRSIAGETVEFMGKVSEDDLAYLYGGAKAFLALADDEDFGITPVEAMMMGTPVVAYYGGGFRESVIEGKTGVFVKELRVEDVVEAVKEMENGKWRVEKIKAYAQKFSKERFVKEMKTLVREERMRKRRVDR